MKSYGDLKFAPVLIIDVFETMKASAAWFDRVHLKKGEPEVPYLSQTRSDNSIAAIVADQGVAPESGNCITVTLKTQATFYQPVPFYTAQNFLVFRHRSMNENSGLFLTTIMRRAMQKFSWGYGVSMERLSKTRIMAPVTTDVTGKQVIDWDGMSSCGAELMVAAAESARRVQSVDFAKAVEDLPVLQYEPMLITDVFGSVKASTAWFDKAKLHVGDDDAYPFVSRGKASNGVGGFTARQARLPECGQAITIGLDTQTVAYQPVAFYTSQNIQVLRHPLLDRDAGLVLVACLQKQMRKFSWGGNGATLGRLKKTRIMVPVTRDVDGRLHVDWAGMGRFGEIIRARTVDASAKALP
ncbi:restriction endonuclease subunit S [Rathayibacter tritici]|uniref:Type I restriction modification DNA specificity domain-containing protein n=1 Tax=Rathayibacter tritici TaxID=33888 RepID=A0A160KX02_9MICO|nr:restriction endonuclease subunit S [Rathayibacter tritici]AND17998.1 hypothetical protein A6122_2890 [Rathayibacter tritici]PPI47453.1 hypothetical protein C5D18_03565 [Rathayibacter tritici]